MATITIDAFSGIIPRTHPTLLPDGCAVVAHNCTLKSGKLSPLKQPSIVRGMKIGMEGGLTAIGDTQTLYLWHFRDGGKMFLAWGGIATVAQSNIADDTRSRIFVTGATGFGDNLPCCYAYSSDRDSFERVSLLKDKLPSPVVSLLDDNPSDEDNVRYTYFFQTWVDKFGYESPVSKSSFQGDPQTPGNDGSFEYSDGDTVIIGGLSTAPKEATLRRFYKVVTGTEGENIQFIGEQKKVGTGFLDFVFSLKDEDAGEVIPMIEGMPKDLKWMSYTPGSFYVGLSTSLPRTIFFSDVNRPTSWPSFYQYDIRDNAVGLAVVGNTVVVMTKGYPWIVSGTAPDSMSPQKLASPQACVSPRSICTMMGAAFYASADGICMIAPGASDQAVVITEKYFDKRAWSALNPSSCVMTTYDNALHAWFTLPNGVQRSYIIDIDEGVSAITTHDERAKAVTYDPETDALYFIREV